MGRYIIIALVVMFLVPSIKFLRGHERMAVFRLGRFFRIVGPGFVFLIPMVDKGVRVNLSEKIPGWQALSRDELDRRITAFVIVKKGAGS